MELRLGLNNELKEKFEANIIGTLVKLYANFNPSIKQCTYIPYSILHNGRNEHNKELIGLTLRLNPGVYNIQDNGNIGGLDEKNLNIASPTVFWEMNNSNFDITKVICINYRGLYFNGEIEKKVYAEKWIVDTGEYFEQQIELLVYYSSDGLVFRIPLFESSYDYANSLNSGELLNIVKSCIMR